MREAELDTLVGIGERVLDWIARLGLYALLAAVVAVILIRIVQYFMPELFYERWSKRTRGYRAKHSRPRREP